jgi:phospholipid-translocating ATPase
VNGKEELYALLCILDFDNVRKRMSVVVKDPSGQIKLYCKGADSMIMERLSEESKELKKITSEHLDKFANDALRTLCLAYKKIGQCLYFAM